jgi:tetratricopeptide (TPR) repeat protein
MTPWFLHDEVEVVDAVYCPLTARPLFGRKGAVLHNILQLVGGGGIGGGVFALVVTVFQVWMFINALRRGEYIWAVFIFIGWGISAVFYYLMVYRMSAAANPLAGFELPGAADRRQIARLKAEIHHLDKAHLHLQLGDIYLSQGKLADAEASYRAAYARDPQDEDVRAHLGNCLARRDKPQEALPLLESVCAQNPKHDYGYTLMTLAEAQAAAGQTDRALATWRRVLGLYQYSRARVQFAELLMKTGAPDEARKNLDEVISESAYAPKFQRKREAVWVRRAKALRGQLPR